MDPALQELIRPDQHPWEIQEVLVRLWDQNRIPSGLRIITQYGEIATARVMRSKIPEIYAAPEIRSLKASRGVTPEWSVPGSKAFNSVSRDVLPSPFFKKPNRNVLIGIIDFGLDIDHQVFKWADGSSRLLGLWDQSGVWDGNTYGYGKMNTKAEIAQAVASRYPYRHLAYHPAKGDPKKIGAHGTHVASIAASTAPWAELAFVHLATRGNKGIGNLGERGRIPEAMHYLDHLAGDRPLVINLSIGKTGGPHDGKTLVELAMDSFLEGRPDRVICQSVGNYFHTGTHTSGKFHPHDLIHLPFTIQKGDKTSNEIEIWYEKEDRVRVGLQAPGSEKVIWVNPDENQTIRWKGKEIGRLYHRTREPNNSKNHIDLFLFPGAPYGQWELIFHPLRIRNGFYHAWAERDSGCRFCQTVFPKAYRDRLFTTNTICNGKHTIVTGAADLYAATPKAAYFSSSGPTVDGRPKPDILAHGVRVKGAKSAAGEQNQSSNSFTLMSGTSMASPQVTGAAAAILGYSRRPMYAFEVKRKLQDSSDLIGKKVAPYRSGAGILNLSRLAKGLLR
jgi:hypothetical protein